MDHPGSTTAWAHDVAAHLDRFADDHSPTVVDLWVSRAPALVIRYRLGVQCRGMRTLLDRDPTSWEVPTDSERLASNLLHALHSPGDLEWTDDDGHAWWGDRPEHGWASMLDEERTATLRRSRP